MRNKELINNESTGLLASLTSNMNEKLESKQISQKELELIYSLLLISKESNEISEVSYDYIRKEMDLDKSISDSQISDRLKDLLIILDEVTMIDNNEQGFLAFKLFPTFESIPFEKGGYIQYSTLFFIRELILENKG